MAARTSKRLVTKIPNRSIILSRLSIVPQSIRVLHEEIPTKEIIRGERAENKLQILCNETREITNSENYDRWTSGSSIACAETRTIGEDIREGICNCFDIAVVLNIQLERNNIENAIAEGFVIETALRQFWITDPRVIPILHPSALHLNDEDTQAAHNWNVAYINGKTYLVDAAFPINGGAVVEEIRGVNERDHITLELPDGKYRHYISNGVCQVE